jgi:GT2 family glycosyltransferase
MSNFDKISIIIVNYNTAELTVNCIRSIYQKTVDLDFEVILIDNGSNDNTVEIVQKEFQNYGNLIIIKNEENFGFAKACNIGAKRASGKYLCFLNTDTVLVNNAFLYMVNLLRKEPKIAVIGPQLLNEDMSIQHSITSVTLKSIVRRVIGIDILIQKDSVPFLEKAKSCYILKNGESLLGACIVVRKEIFELLKGFDENFFFTGEEGDFILNVMKNGFEVCYLPEAKIIHFSGKTVKKLDSVEKVKILFYYYYGLNYFAYKNYGKAASILVYFLILIRLFISTCYNAIRKNLANYQIYYNLFKEFRKKSNFFI